MNNWKQFVIGLKAFKNAFLFVKTHRLYHFFITPAILMLILYKLGEYILNRKTQFSGNTINEFTWQIIYSLIDLSLALLLMKFAKYLVVIILSPMLAHLSLKCEKLITGNTYSYSYEQLWLDVVRGFRIVTRNILWEYLFFAIIYLIAIIGWDDMRMSPIFYISFLIGFYYYGFSFIDYINERRKLTVAESIIFVRKHRGLAISIGLGYSFLIFMPVDLSKLFAFHQISKAPLYTITNMALHLILWLAASIAPIIAVIASNLAMHEIVDLKRN